MMQEIIDNFRNKYTDLIKLNTIYLLLIIAMVTVAGLISLLNQDAAHAILSVVKYIAAALIVNIVSWSLVGPVVRKSRSKKSTSKK